MGESVPKLTDRVAPTEESPTITAFVPPVNDRAGTTMVSELVVEADVTSSAVPVAVTESRLPASAGATVYCADVAPEIAVPPRFHWYVITAVGLHAAVAAVNT